MSKPRKLTSEEITDILNFFPKPKGVLNIIIDHAHEQIKKVHKYILEDIEIVPEGIPMLKDEIYNSFTKSIIKPGSMVGIWSASFQGRFIQQTALDSFHKAGQSGGRGPVSNLDRLKELYTVLKNPKDPSCEIFFNEKGLTYNKIWKDYRPRLIEISVGKLVKDFEIEFPKVYFPEGKFPYWYYLFSQTKNIVLPTIKDNIRFMRLYFDPTSLLEYKITLTDICNTLMNKSSDISIPMYFDCIYSPQNIGIIDIWPNENSIGECIKDQKISEEDSVFACLYHVVLPSLDEYVIKGIKGISEVMPMKINKYTTFKHWKEKVPEGIKIQATRRFHISGVTWEEIEELFNAFTKVKEINKKEGYIVVEEDKETEIMKVASQSDDSELKSKVINYFAITNGSSLEKIISLPFVRLKGTISNNPREVMRIFGIDAATNVFIKEIYNFFGIADDKIPINIRHIYIIAEFTSYYGYLLPNTYAGIAKQNKNTFAAASFERQLSTIIENSIMGSREKVNDVSSSIILNEKLKIGPNAFEDKDEELAPISLEQLRERLKESDISSDNLIQALREKGLSKYYEDSSKFITLRGDEKGDDNDDIEDEGGEEDTAPIEIKSASKQKVSKFSEDYEYSEGIQDILMTVPTKPLEYLINDINAENLFDRELIEGNKPPEPEEDSQAGPPPKEKKSKKTVAKVSFDEDDF
jgi:hypothetical protein